MTEFVHLVGAEQVQNAANRMDTAVQSFSHSVSSLNEAIDKFSREIAELYMLIDRFEAALESDRTERFALATLKVTSLDQVTIETWVERLRPIYTTRQALLWLYSPHRLLNGETPADCIVAGNEDQVLAVIEQLMTGAHV